MKAKLEIYRSGVFKRVWRWKLRDYNNGKVIAASTEGYSNRADCIDNVFHSRDVLNELPSRAEGLREYVVK